MANSSYLNQHLHPSLPHSRHLATANLSHGGQVVLPNAVMKSAPAPHPSLSDTSFQPGPSKTPGVVEKSNIVRNPSEAVNWPLKKAKLDGGESSSLPLGSNVSNICGFKTSQTFGVDSAPDKLVPRTEEVQYAGKQVYQPQLAPDVESVLLQQVLNLTPEQLNSLPPEQRQQVIQLQQALRQDQMQQPS
ncbi:Kinase superfamily protein [Hibiscus syriacus]|uniref:Kinase superfamily protein n=1 Tax=Hibiscus syriacus TaxID=106335 RepID=A0A6A3CL29_HIBSY|nr:Kinase superfamily protein [Hibiscus syriacus]